MSSNPGDQDNGNKESICVSMLESLRNDPENNEDGEKEEGDGRSEDDDGVPTGRPPAGWESLSPDDQNSPTHAPNPTPVMVTTLLKLRRGELETTPDNRKLQLLLQEQNDLKLARTAKDKHVPRCIRTNLHEMAGGEFAPVQDGTQDQWVWYLYERLLEKEVANLQKPVSVSCFSWR